VHILQALKKLLHYFGCLSFSEAFSTTGAKTDDLILSLMHASPDKEVKILALDKFHH
jgi:hypothetical protein